MTTKRRLTEADLPAFGALIDAEMEKVKHLPQVEQDEKRKRLVSTIVWKIIEHNLRVEIEELSR